MTIPKFCRIINSANKVFRNMFDLLDISTFCKISHIYIEATITNVESIVKWIGRLEICYEVLGN